jgi:hypothetical protein
MFIMTGWHPFLSLTGPLLSHSFVLSIVALHFRKINKKRCNKDVTSTVYFYALYCVQTV